MPDFFYAVITDWAINRGIKIAVIIFGGFILFKTSRVFIKKTISRYVNTVYKTRDDESKGKRENTLNAVFISIIKIAVYTSGLLIILSETGINISPLVAGAGIAGLAFSLGGQYLIRDFIAGFFIILEDQYRKGDVIKIGDTIGFVEHINLRRTVIKDLEGAEHHIPNGTITIASNMTKTSARVNINIGVAYKENVDYVFDVLNRLGKEMANDEKWKNDIIEPIRALGIEDFAESSVVIKATGEVKPARQWDAGREYRRRVKNDFDRLGIEIPYPHRTVIQK